MADNAKYEGFSAEEREAMKARAAELKTASKKTGGKKAEAEAKACADTIAGCLTSNERSARNCKRSSAL